MSGAPALVSGYVEEVVRRLRDLPPAEQAEIEADLRRHLIEIGCVTGRDCVERLGTPEHYAAGLREGLGLGEYRRSHAPWLAAALAVFLVVAAAVGWRATRTEPLPDDFSPFRVGSWMASGSDVRVAGGMLITLGSEPGTARMSLVVTNRSDRTLAVERIGLATVRSRGSITTYGGDASEPLRPGEIEISAIWSPDVRIEPVADPVNLVLGDHPSVGAPFAPFAWEPDTTYVISLDGPVAACRDGLTEVDGANGPVAVDFTIGDHGFDLQVQTYAFDTSAC